MEHINSLFGSRMSGLKNLKSFLPGGTSLFKRSLSKVDGVFTISMIIFGIIGCLSVLYLQAAPERHLDNSLILTGSSPGHLPTALATTGSVISKESTNKKPAFVRIEGQRKAGKTLTFVIDAFEKDASYQFVFGNGKTLKVTDRKTTFSYGKSGLYEVFLDVTFQGENKKLPIESLWIAK